jgi:hypothetical protein
VSNGYRKFSSKFVGDGDKPKTFATFATFADGISVFQPYQDTNNCPAGPPNSQSASVKVAKVAKVEAPEAAVGLDGLGCEIAVAEVSSAGARYREAFAFLLIRSPAHISVERWQQAVEDGRSLLAAWGEQADALGWTSRDLFGLDTPPADPHPSYSRLSRYDNTGLCWLLQGKEVIAMTADTATIRNPSTGAITIYRRFNKPALGPAGDSLDDFK